MISMTAVKLASIHLRWQTFNQPWHRIVRLEFPPLLLHKKIFRLSLTLPIDKNKLALRFRRLRRDSRFPVQMQSL